MLTKEDIAKLAAVLATKEDLREYYNKSEMDLKFSSLPDGRMDQASSK